MSSRKRRRDWVSTGSASAKKRRRIISRQVVTTTTPLRRRRPMNLRTGGFLGIEKKFFDSGAVVALTSPTDATGGEVDPASYDCLNCVPQGDGESERDGRQISMSRIFIHGTITCAPQINQTAIDRGSTNTIWLVLDTQTNGAQLDSEDVLTQSANAEIAPLCFRNLQYSKRFRILARKTVTIPPPPVSWDGTNIEQGGYSKYFSMQANLRGMKVNFSNTSAVVASITDNSLHVIAFTNNTTMAPTINYFARLRYYG